MLSLVYGPTLASIHDSWKKHTLGYTEARSFILWSVDSFPHHQIFIDTLLSCDAAEDGIVASQACKTISPSEKSGDSCVIPTYTGLGSIQVAIPSWGLLERLQGEFNDLGKPLC